jgi:Predicted membrane protein (DUF2335)
MYRLGMADPEHPGTPRSVAGDDDVVEADDLVDGERRAEGPELPIQAGLVSPPLAWPGVLLTPETLATYEELVPGAAERILKMAELTARIDAGVWSDDENGWWFLTTLAALVFFGLAAGGVGTHATLIAGVSLTAVSVVAGISACARWMVVTRRRDQRRRRDQA